MDTEKNFDDAFIEDSDLNNAILDISNETITDKTMRCVNNSSIAAKEKMVASCQVILEDLKSVIGSEFSSENSCTWKMAGITPKSTGKNCIWEFAGITPKSTDKNCIWEIAGIMPWSTDNTVRESAKEHGLISYSTTSMSRRGLKESLSTISVTPKTCSVAASNILLTYDSPSKKIDGFSSSPRSLAVGELGSCNIPQSQPLKSTLEGQNDIVKSDNRCRGERKGTKCLQARTMLTKKRARKEKYDPRKKNCLDLSITIVPPVSLKDDPSKMLDSKEDLITDKSFLLTGVALPNSSLAQSLPLNGPLDTNNDVVNTDGWSESGRSLGPGSEEKLLAETTKAVRKCTGNVVPRKRKHMGQLVDETVALSQPISKNKTCVVKFPLHSKETVCPSPIKDAFICNRTVQSKDICVDITSLATSPASDGNAQLISCDLASSNSDASKQNCLWEMYSGGKLLSVQDTNSVLGNESTEPCSDDNAVLSDELKNWEPFSTNDFSKTVGAVTEDNEMTMQNTEASDANLASAQLLSDQSKQAKKKNRRKSMSADRFIASQIVEMPSPEMTDSDQTFSRKRYPQRLRRRSTELFQFTQIEAFSDVAEEAETVESKGSQLEPSVRPTAGNETEVHLESQSLVNDDDPKKLGFECTARSVDELTLDYDASSLDSDLNLYRAPAKPSRSRLRRKSTELYRLSQNNQNQPLITLEEMPEQESISQQNDNVYEESRGKQSGINKVPRCPKQKKNSKAEEGPPLEDIYRNRLWRSQMPKDALLETIPEDPKYNRETGGLSLFSIRKAKRFLDFEEGPSLSHLKKRKLKGMKNGWKPLTKKRDHALSKLLVEKLSQLDGEIGVGEARV